MIKSIKFFRNIYSIKPLIFRIISLKWENPGNILVVGEYPAKSPRPFLWVFWTEKVGRFLNLGPVLPPSETESFMTVWLFTGDKKPNSRSWGKRKHYFKLRRVNKNEQKLSFLNKGIGVTRNLGIKCFRELSLSIKRITIYYFKSGNGSFCEGKIQEWLVHCFLLLGRTCEAFVSIIGKQHTREL